MNYDLSTLNRKLEANDHIWSSYLTRLTGQLSAVSVTVTTHT